MLPRPTVFLTAIALLVACTDKSGDTAEDLCPVSGEPSLTIGYGVRDQFTPYEEGPKSGS